MTRDSKIFSIIELEASDQGNGWSGTSSAVLMIVTSLYWVLTWLAAGVPPLSLIASRGHESGAKSHEHC
jgi:uncharacterized membrane protein YhaH (DUF805 family)